MAQHCMYSHPSSIVALYTYLDLQQRLLRSHTYIHLPAHSLPTPTDHLPNAYQVKDSKAPPR